MSGVELNFTQPDPFIATARPRELEGRTGLGEAIGAGFTSAAEQGFRRDDARRREAYGIYMDPIDRHMQGNIELPGEIMQRVLDEGFDPSLDTLEEIRAWVEDEGPQYGYDATAFEDPSEVIARRDQIEGQATELVGEQQSILERAGPGTRLAGELIGGVGAEFTDPFNLLTLPAGAPARAGLLTTMAVEAGINAALELAENPARSRMAEDLGQEGQSALQAATIGALFGAGGAAGMRGLQLGAELGFDRIGRMLDTRATTRIAQTMSRSEDPLEQALGQAVLADLEDAAQVGARETRPAQEEHERRLEAGARTLEGGAPPPDRPATLRPAPDRPGGVLESVDTREITFDDSRPSQRINEPFDPDRAGGVATIFEAEDGTRILLDGRARVEAAREAGINTMPSRIYRQLDGFDLDDMREIIARTDEWQPSAVPRIAQDFQTMHDELFQMISSGGIDAAIGSVVSRALRDTPELQLAMARALNDRGISDVAEAQRMIPELIEGLEEVRAETDIAARQKVLTRAMEEIENDDELLDIMRAGRADLDGDNADVDAQLIADAQDLIQRNLGNREVERAINNAARRYAATGRLGDGARQLLSQLRNFAGRQARDGAGSRRDGGDARAQGEAPPAQDGFAGFEDPLNGAGVDGQIAATPLVREPAPEGFSDDVAGRQDLKRRVEDGAGREEIDTHPTVVEALAEMEARAARATDLDLVYNSREWHETRQYVFKGDDVVTGTRDAMLRFHDEALRFAGERGALRERRATILLGPPAAGKSSIAEGLALDQRAAIIDPDEIKKTLPEFEGGIGAAAVHEESSDLAKILMGLMRAEGTNMIVPKVGGSSRSIRSLVDRFREAGYEVNIVNMAVEPDEAYRRMIGRFVDTGRLIPPSYMDEVGSSPSATYRELREEGVADGYAEIDNNGAFRAPKPIIDRAGSTNPLAGSRFDLSEGRGNLLVAPDGGAGRDSAGLATADIIRRDALADRVAVSVEEVDRNTQRAVTMTRAELEEDLVEDENLASVLFNCVR
jgi:hypothetical protein